MILQGYLKRVGWGTLKASHQAVYEKYRLWMLHTGACVFCRNAIVCAEGETLRTEFYTAEMSLRSPARLEHELDEMIMTTSAARRTKKELLDAVRTGK